MSPADPAPTAPHTPAGDTSYDGIPGPAGVLAPGYEVRHEIARGGMGIVYAAFDLALGRDVAIKVPHPGRATDADTLQRFVRESRLTARLPHPGVPPVYALGRLADGRPFLAMKLVEGRTLADLLKARRDPAEDLPRFVVVFEQVCQAVGYAHSQGVIHRDLKPANVMVGSFGEVLVMDWGLARVSLEDAPAVEMTVAGAVLGTPAYMPPEQARGELDRLDPRSDVFGLGAILCEILTGRAPYAGGSGSPALRQAAAGDLADALSRLNRCGADPELVGLAWRCLSPEPAGRPRDGKAVADAVAAFRAGVEARLRRSERDRAAATAKAAELRKRRRVQRALAAAVALIVVGGGGVAWWLDREAGRRRADEARLEGEREAERRVRTEQTRQEAAAALKLAADLRDQHRFAEAAAAVAQAKRVLAGGGADDLAAAAEQAGADLDFARELDAARMKKVTWDPRKQAFDAASAPPAYRIAFRVRGMDLAADDPAAVAEKVKAFAIRPAVVEALDDWSLDEPDSEVLRRVLAVARAADPGPWRDRLRDPAVRDDRRRLAELERDADPAAESPTALVVLARLMDRRGLPPDRLLTAAQVRHPASFDIAFALSQRSLERSPARAVGHLRACRAIRPTDTAVLTNLSKVLLDLKDYDEAIDLSREALRIDPRDAVAHFNLGSAHHARNELDAAERSYRDALALDPNLMAVHNNLGNVLRERGDLAGAEQECREALRLAPRDPDIHFNLAMVLREQAKFAEALEHARRGHELGSAQPGWKKPSAEWVKEYESLPRRDAKLMEVLAGGVLPRAPAEVFELAHFAYQYRRRYADAVRLFRAGFAIDPSPSDRHRSGQRAGAARAAARAAEGQGVAPPPPEDRPGLRRQALDWLSADLAGWKKELAASPSAAKEVARRMQLWLGEPAFAPVRDPARLPAEESTAWEQFWSEVRALRERASRVQ